METKYIQPFVNAAVQTFKSMLNMDITEGRPLQMKSAFSTHDISGMMGLTGRGQGVLVMSYPFAVADEIIRIFMGVEGEVSEPELVDGIGELANIVTGSAKHHFSMFNLSLSLPGVVIGEDHRIQAPSGTPVIAVPMHTPVGDFVIEVALKFGAPQDDPDSE